MIVLESPLGLIELVCLCGYLASKLLLLTGDFIAFTRHLLNFALLIVNLQLQRVHFDQHRLQWLVYLIFFLAKFRCYGVHTLILGVPTSLCYLLTFLNLFKSFFNLRHLLGYLNIAFTHLNLLLLELLNFPFAACYLCQLVLLFIVDDSISTLQSLEVPLEVLVSLFCLLLLAVQIVDVGHQHGVFCEKDALCFFLFLEKLALLAELLCTLVILVN